MAKGGAGLDPLAKEALEALERKDAVAPVAAK